MSEFSLFSSYDPECVRLANRSVLAPPIRNRPGVSQVSTDLAPLAQIDPQTLYGRGAKGYVDHPVAAANRECAA
ncbi:hypothetical protein C8J47_3757 [Sphingomonas sp. PP-F2F-G114-C0414]|uniref:hypothetical protein n=1 Tax=Sphingomonas sp. PP-F2F-G114-C0414 TaxID=2135662 RepID=UPI000EF94B57|nr:hypothetical protein [Sphingomonas sp. PP-F2F-G114-C0414]RMB24856.1 hypothetical protein C8J47_3757 [Sphingomonas sp. PP-F2F-G114-C0414]